MAADQPATPETLILGFETSCDETAAAVVKRSADGSGRILSNIVLSQTAAHAPFGGVVPEIAARSHIEHIYSLGTQALDDASITMDDVHGVAATAGPGLLGGLLVGLSVAKGAALAANKPFLAVNHLEGHALTPRLTEARPFPYLLLLVSGGHTQFQLVRGVGDYTRLGTTIDDALGEAFDKVAKLLGLAYPGGPQVEIMARTGNPERFALPHPLKGRPDCNFSFSGLKTAVRELVADLDTPTSQDLADVCASFQRAVEVTIEDRLLRAFDQFRRLCPTAPHPALVVAGGVAANAQLRTMFERATKGAGFALSIPPFHLCTDNAAMIAWAGAERLALGLIDRLDFAARARWPLDTVSAPVYGSGKLGAKA